MNRMSSKFLIVEGFSLLALFSIAEPMGGAPAGLATNAAPGLVARETGGRIKTLHRNTKEVNYINAQNRVKGEVLEAARAKMEEVLRTPIGMKFGSFD